MVDHLLQHSCGVEDKVRFAVECGSERKKGIHIRNWKADKPMDVSVAVEPVMLNDTEAGKYQGGTKLGILQSSVQLFSNLTSKKEETS